MSITKKERKKIGAFIMFVTFGTLLSAAARKLWIDGLLDTYNPHSLIIVSLIGLFIIYYAFDFDHV